MTPPDLPQYSTREIVLDATGQNTFYPGGPRQLGHNPSWVKAADHAVCCVHLQQQIEELKLDLAFREMMTHKPEPEDVDDEIALLAFFIRAHPDCDLEALLADFAGRAVAALRQQNQELVAALKACSFRLATVVAASGVFHDVDAQALDAATAALANAEGTR